MSKFQRSIYQHNLHQYVSASLRADQPIFNEAELAANKALFAALKELDAIDMQEARLIKQLRDAGYTDEMIESAKRALKETHHD